MFFNVAIALTGLHVLVVDSDPDSCELLRFVLQLYGMTVQTALSVRQALARFTEAQPDLLIANLRLPETDGYELLRRIRSLEPVRGGKAIAVAVTADVTQLEQRAIAAGFAKLLFTPIDMDELVVMLADLVKQEENKMCHCS